MRAQLAAVYARLGTEKLEPYPYSIKLPDVPPYEPQFGEMPPFPSWPWANPETPEEYEAGSGNVDSEYEAYEMHDPKVLNFPLPATTTTTASVPFMVTKAMEADLIARGYSAEQIRTMTPAEAHTVLGTMPSSVVAAPATAPPAQNTLPDENTFDLVSHEGELVPRAQSQRNIAIALRRLLIQPTYDEFTQQTNLVVTDRVSVYMEDIERQLAEAPALIEPLDPDAPHGVSRWTDLALGMDALTRDKEIERQQHLSRQLQLLHEGTLLIAPGVVCERIDVLDERIKKHTERRDCAQSALDFHLKTAEALLGATVTS